MRFFVPLSNDPGHGEDVYRAVRNRLEEMREPAAERRIYVLKFEEDGKRRTIAVGDEVHRLGDGPVVAILQGGTSCTYYVCTPRHGAFEGEPYAVPKDHTLGVEEFSALA